MELGRVLKGPGCASVTLALVSYPVTLVLAVVTGRTPWTPCWTLWGPRDVSRSSWLWPRPSLPVGLPEHPVEGGGTSSRRTFRCRYPPLVPHGRRSLLGGQDGYGTPSPTSFAPVGLRYRDVGCMTGSRPSSPLPGYPYSSRQGKRYLQTGSRQRRVWTGPSRTVVVSLTHDLYGQDLWLRKDSCLNLKD